MLPVAVVGFLLIGLLMVAMPFLVQGVLTRQGEGSTLAEGQRRHKRNASVLWRLFLLAIGYSALLRYLHTLTGIAALDGSIGLVLGLYICSHPAAYAVNMLFFERDTLRQLSEWSVVRWLALNLLVLLAGWTVIFIGVRRLVDRVVY